MNFKDQKTQPPNWATADIESINFFKGNNINPSLYPEEKFELYSVPIFPTGKPELTQGKDIGSTKQTVQPGDVLLCKINPRINRVWRVEHKGAFPQIASSEWIVIRNTTLEPRYLRHYFSSAEFRDEICKEVTGVGGSLTRAQPKRVKTLLVPVPPVNEQRRIADKLDTTLAAVEACKQKLNNAAETIQRFRQSVLAAAVSGELTREWREERGIEGEWEDVLLSDIADIQGGITKDSKKQLEEYPERPYLRVANVQRGFLALETVTNIRAEPKKADKLILKRNDILFNEGGDRDKVGRGWIWEEQIKDCIFQNHIFRARLYNEENQAKFISHWANTIGATHFLQQGKQTTNLASISKKTLGQLPIKLPSAEEQKEIVERIEAMFSEADFLEEKNNSALKCINSLVPSILAKAFRGELVPQDPNDEPASVLLERIKAQREAEAAAKKPVKRGRKKKADPAQLVIPAGIVDNHLAKVLEECGALSRRALLAASELEPNVFGLQLEKERGKGLIMHNTEGMYESTNTETKNLP